jgi:transcriptional regulator with XRE-family HTH domain
MKNTLQINSEDGYTLFMRELGRHLTTVMEAEGISMKEVARRMGNQNLQSVMSRILGGKEDRPRIDTLYRIADAIGKQLVVRFADEDEAKAENAEVEIAMLKHRLEAIKKAVND